jgi:hypothetical protein
VRCQSLFLSVRTLLLKTQPTRLLQILFLLNKSKARLITSNGLLMVLEMLSEEMKSSREILEIRSGLETKPLADSLILKKS